MELYDHQQPSFTRWVVTNKFLREPFVIIDVGVQGGEHPRWQHLGEYARVHGFDAIHEVIDRLNAAPHHGHGQATYYALALGNEDGQRDFYVGAETFSSSFYHTDRTRTGQQNGIALGARRVNICRLDSLFAGGTLPLADHIKLDCEGFEPEVLRGGKAYLAHSNILCATVETSFGVSPLYPRTQFAEISDLLLAHRLLVFDVIGDRATRPGYAAALNANPWPPPDPMTDFPDIQVGQPRTFDFLFCRDFVREHTNPDDYSAQSAAPPTPDKLIKAMINFELHGLMDCAVDIAEHFRTVLAPRFDVGEAIRLLVRRPPQPRNIPEIVNALVMIDDLRQEAGRALAQAHAAQRDCDTKVAAVEAEAARERERLHSIRFVSKALMRELAARVRTRFGR